MRKLFCSHRWRVIARTKIDVYLFEVRGLPDRVDTDIDLLCLKCGTLKTKKFKGFQANPDTWIEIFDAKGWKYD